MSHKALLIGQAPARSAGPDTRPWDSASGRRLAAFMGTTHERLLAVFETDNLNKRLTGTRGKYDAFDTEEAKERAAEFLQRIRAGEWDFVLLCSQKVCKLMGVSMYRWYVMGKHTMVLGLPHPGGTNMTFNKPENHARMTLECRKFWLMVSGESDT